MHQLNTTCSRRDVDILPRFDHPSFASLTHPFSSGTLLAKREANNTPKSVFTNNKRKTRLGFTYYILYAILPLNTRHI